MQVFKIHNANKNCKQSFEALQPGLVKIYVCGMTVYDFCHIGHARVMVFFDVVTRLLRNAGYTVNYTRNITDVDDKIIARAAKNNTTIAALTSKYIAEMHKDEASLGNLSPDYEPKASENISNMIDLIQTLIVKKHAYVGDDGDVWFDVKSYEGYGLVSGQNISDLKSGVRKEIISDKKDVLDFCLWKLADSSEPGWQSPWGFGRPGWHIECSAMASSYLGFTIDIHGGGIDLKFPHHENESAQSSCAFDADYVRNWMHVGHVTDNSEKMSKSLGNFITIREALNIVSGEAIRYLLLTSHYRKPLPFSQDNLLQSAKVIARFYRVLSALPPSEVDVSAKHVQDFMVAMQDDFNTVRGFAICFEMVKSAYKTSESNLDAAKVITANLRYVLQLLGFALSSPDEYLKGNNGLSSSEIEGLIAARTKARTDGNWKLADKIREDLLVEGIVLEDNASGTNWRSV